MDEWGRLALALVAAIAILVVKMGKALHSHRNYHSWWDDLPDDAQKRIEARDPTREWRDYHATRNTQESVGSA